MSSAAPPPGVSIADARLQEVSDGIYAYIQPDGSWWINNTGFLVGRRGVVSVDACSTQRRTRAYLDAIASVTGQPVRTLINTHHHGDHTFGNCLFGGATIVAHERCREEMLAFGPPGQAPFWTEVDWGELELAPPFLTYTSQVRVWVDDLPCEVRHVGAPAHTTNDSIVWVPDRSLLFAGDLLFRGGTPFLLMGSVTGAIGVLEDLKQLPATTIVPGHGEVAGPELIDDVAGYLRFVLAAARSAADAGLSPLDAARELDLGPYAEWLDRERIVGNLHRALAELNGAPQGAPIDVAAALTDMVAYNGGEPLSCYAYIAAHPQHGNVENARPAPTSRMTAARQPAGQRDERSAAMLIRSRMGVSADGFVATPDGLPVLHVEPSFVPGVSHGFPEFIANCDAVVMGRSTFLPAIGAPGWPWPGLQVYVLTSSPLPAGTPKDVIVGAGGPAELARQLRSRGSDKDVHLVGGPRTIRAFHQAGELDRLEIVVLPILLGDGIPLSPPGAGRVPLRLLCADRTFPDGSAELVYAIRMRSKP